MRNFVGEAGRSTGTVKRKGSLDKMVNFGYYLDDDKGFIAYAEKALANTEVSVELAEKIAAAKEALEKESEIAPAAMRDALTRIHGPQARDDAEKEKIFKDARSAVFLVRKAIYNEKLDGMVNTLTSKYASNAKRVLEDGIHTIEVTKKEMERYGITGDDVSDGLYSAATLTKSMKSKAVSEFIVKMRPQLEKAIDAIKAADAINTSDLSAILMEMKTAFDTAQEAAEQLKETVRVTVASAGDGELANMRTQADLGESVVNEGIFAKLTGWFSRLVSRMGDFMKNIIGLTDEASAEVDSIMSILGDAEESFNGTEKTESKGKEQVLQELQDIADILAERGPDGEPDALIDVENAVDGTEWMDAVGAILSDSSIDVKTAITQAIETIKES